LLTLGTHVWMLWANPTLTDSEKRIHAWVNLGAAAAIVWELRL